MTAPDAREAASDMGQFQSAPASIQAAIVSVSAFARKGPLIGIRGFPGTPFVNAKYKFVSFPRPLPIICGSISCKPKANDFRSSSLVLQPNGAGSPA